MRGVTEVVVVEETGVAFLDELGIGAGCQREPKDLRTVKRSHGQVPGIAGSRIEREHSQE